jgi:hypothetical protein
MGFSTIGSCLLIVLSSCVWSSSASPHKKLIMMIGPHGVDTSAIELFYYKYANPKASPAEALADWTWPDQDGELVSDLATDGRRVYKHLVEESSNEELQKELLTNIQVGWDQSTSGVIIATEEFDRIGEDFIHRDGFEAMKRVVEKVNVGGPNVEVVLHYRMPRLNQWLSFWKDATVVSKQTYAEYICSGDENAIMNALESSMNPLKLAKTVREAGWQVNIVDTARVAAKNLDVAHVLGCNVLGLDCQGGWIDGLEDKTFDAGEVDGELDASSLDAKVQTELESLFRFRDCHYKDVIDDDGIKILPHDNTISDMLKDECHHHKRDIYELLANSTFLYNVLRTQFDCHDGDIDINVLLGVKDSSGTGGQGSAGTGGQDGPGTGGQDGPGTGGNDVTTTKVNKETRTTKSNTAGGEVVALLLLAVAVAMMGIYILHRRMQKPVKVVDLSAFDSEENRDVELPIEELPIEEELQIEDGELA